jgi:hypothetical protein
MKNVVFHKSLTHTHTVTLIMFNSKKLTMTVVNEATFR